MTVVEKLEQVERVIKMLRLEKCADTPLGDTSKRGVSGGERKRTNVANELLVNPSLIMLDEPTSGLDSRTAYELVVTLKALAQSGRTVLSSIHQPSSEVMHLFGSLVLMVDGHTVYAGAASKAISHFEQVGYGCPGWTNPADFYLMLLVNDGEDAPRNRLITAWEGTEKVAVEHLEIVTGDVCEEDETAMVEASYLWHGESYAVSYVEQLRVLFDRSMKTRWGTLVTNKA